MARSKFQNPFEFRDIKSIQLTTSFVVGQEPFHKQLLSTEQYSRTQCECQVLGDEGECPQKEKKKEGWSSRVNSDVKTRPLQEQGARGVAGGHGGGGI